MTDRLVVSALLALGAPFALAGCQATADAEVHESEIAAVPLEYDAPTYSAPVKKGLLVRAGERRTVLRQVADLGWLPNGTALVRSSGALRVLDPAAGRFTGARLQGMQQVPSRSVSQVTMLSEAGLTAYDLSLKEIATYDLPHETNANAELDIEDERSYVGATPAIDGVIFVGWHGGDPHDDTDHGDRDYGVLRIDGDKRDDVLVNDRIDGLYLSADGASLLAVRNRSSDPCGGCQVKQEIVEIDPDSGKLVGEYGMPKPYTKDWHIQAVDKVGDRVAVRFYEAVWENADASQPTNVLRGTWVYDGDGWELLRRSEQEVTWWQSPDDRVVARLKPGRSDEFSLVWLHGDQETPLPGHVERLNHDDFSSAVPGQLLPPPS